MEDEGELAFVVGQRAIVQRIVARCFDGVFVSGPPWRVDPYEQLPSYREWLDAADQLF